MNEKLQREGKGKLFVIAGVLLCAMIAVPLLNQGIMCGDELDRKSVV